MNKTLKKGVKKLSKEMYKRYQKSKRNNNYRKQLKADRERIPYKPEKDYPNFEKVSVERFSAFRSAMEDLQKDYPMLLEEYIWYSTLTGDEKENIKKKYKKAGFDRNLWLGVPESEIIDYPDGTYGHPSVSWRCTLPGEGKSFHLSVGYCLSLQWFLFNGEEQHWIPSRNACGPGTKIELRESKYWALLPLFINIAGFNMKGTYPWNKPINDTDQCCFKHDQEYSIRGQSSQKIQMADWAMLYCIKHGKKSEGTEMIKDWLIKNTIKSKLGAEKFVNDGMFGLITEKVDSEEDLPKTYEEFERRTNELLKNKMKTQRTNTRTTNKPKKVTFKSESEEIQRSLQNYKNKSSLPIGSEIELPKSITDKIPKSVTKKIMETAKSLNVTPKTLFITAATSALSGNIKPSTITKIATIASNMNY